MAKTADYKLGEFSFPRGWFVVAESAAIEKRAFNARYFGEDVVLFRGESGAVAMLEAYCPHMGTHLGKSQASHVVTSGHHIEGDSSRVRSYENEIDGHYYRQRESMVGQTPGIGNSFQLDARNERRLTTLTHYTGPGLVTGRFLEANAAQLIATTPIEDGAARLWQCATIKRPPGVSEAQARDMLVSFNRNMAKGLGLEDAEIWANKRAAIQIMQLPTDGPFWQARVWYSQFFNPRDKAPAILERVKGVHGVRGVPGFPAPGGSTAWS